MSPDPFAMQDPAVWMLLTAPGSTGVTIPLRAHVGEGTQGNTVRRVDVRGASDELNTSAGIGTRLAYDILHREKYLSRHIVVRYEPGISLANVHGAAPISPSPWPLPGLRFASGRAGAGRRKQPPL